ncbi:JAB domain-containing protein [Tamlana sp. 2_MG-2023]|uniref:JAB domain-containing protein n=1 Tax=unclassified Tamlana TaxID=2614803 RepID=UPI0026E3EDD7|nr:MULTISPECIES: JAB domain-containing protein [unclassified Tamlana]MDO6761582.1 JAB domain-containing protein [Tamlana sp. 2_MG-2023]MDO6792446.1 JAB domain-containing protein [Tamlana sp. 1_MG-2023]
MKSKVNEIQIGYKENLKASLSIGCSQDACRILYDNWNKDTIGLCESFKILLLNNSNMVKGVYELSTGGLTGTFVDVRILFGIVLKSLSTGVILAHNHPSGKLIPSEADKQITTKIKQGALLLDIKVLDHLIIVPNGGYYSFADSGIL